MASQTMVLFTNDATEVRYSDGSRLQLSPCGASFTFWNSPSRSHGNQVPMLLSNRHIQQRTRYAVSDYKRRVLQALEFRNQFADHPYLCSDIIDKRCLLYIYSDIQQVSWPSSHTNTDVKRLPDGDIQITSIDQCATLKLSNTRQQFSVEFLCKIQREDNIKTKHGNGGFPSKDVQQKYQSQQTSVHSGKLPSNSASDVTIPGYDVNHLSCGAQNTGMSCQTNSACIRNVKGEHIPFGDLSHNAPAGGCIYVWVVQHHSVDSCPLCWRHPLQLALRIPPATKELDSEVKHLTSTPSQDRNKTERNTINQIPTTNLTANEVLDTQLPSALPINCPASHLHSWKDTKIHLQDALQDTAALEMEYAVNGGIKVLMVNGVIYRLLNHTGGSPSIHIYPGDQSVIKSCHSAGGIVCDVFFVHLIPVPDGSIEEKMYSTSNLPPDKPGCTYSLASVLARASRLLQMQLCHSDATSLPCWKVTPPTTIIQPSPTPAVLLEEKHIADVGKFSAYSDGYIRIVFPDRTVLDWRCDLRHCINRYWIKNKGDAYKEMTQTHQLISGSSTASSATCRLLLPNGQYVTVDVHQPDFEYYRYIAVAEEWRTWLNLAPDERTEFYQQQLINDPHRIVHAELKKIQNFTYITETLPTYLPTCDVKDTSDAYKGCRSSNENHQDAVDSHDVSTSSSYGEITTHSEVSLETIREALSKTSQTISSIETLLEH